DDYTAAIVPYVIVLVLWPGLLAAPLYRAITYTYRITDRALFVDRGFLNPPQPVVSFKEIAGVEHGANWLRGWEKLETERPPPPSGVRGRSESRDPRTAM